MPASKSTNPSLPSPTPSTNEKNLEVEKPLPPRPPQFDRTVSEAPVLNSSPHAHHSPPKRPLISGLQPFQRPKKRVFWRGKACIIALPLDDNIEPAAARFLKPHELRERLQQWEARGYSTEGFKLSSEHSDSTGNDVSEGQSRRIYPDPEEMQHERGTRLYRISIPDRRGWEALVSQLNEEKLRALGVSFGDEGVSASTTPAPQTTSRNVPSSNSVAMVSPAMVSSTAPNSGSYIDHIAQQPRPNALIPQSVPTGASQGYLHQGKPGVAHFPRYSMVVPSGGFPPPHPLSRPTPPPSRTWSPPQLYGSQPTTRGASPLVAGPFHNLESTLSPISTASRPDAVLANDQNSRDLLGLMQQEQARLQAQQLHQQQQQQRILFQPPRQPDVVEHGSSNGLHPTRYNSQPEIASPIPRGHRQNLSETLQKEIDDAESSLDYHASKTAGENNDMSNGEEGGANTIVGHQAQVHNTETDRNNEREGVEIKSDVANAPELSKTISTSSQSGHVSKPSMTKLDATAPVFEYPPGKPSGPNVFAFRGDHLPTTPTNSETGHVRRSHIPAEQGGLNVAAPAFVPTDPQQRSAPYREFSFSSSGPTFKPNTPIFDSRRSGGAASGDTASSQDLNGRTTRIFGNVDFSDVIKPAKKSKAIPIIKPSESESDSEDADGQEDESGRITQPEGRQKRVRRNSDEGDQVPQFVDPSSTMIQASYTIPSRSISPLSAEISDKENITPLKRATHKLKEIVDEQSASEVSSLTEDQASASTRDDVWTPFPFANAQEAASFNVALPLQSPPEKPLQDVATELAHATMEAIPNFPTDIVVEDAALDGAVEAGGQNDSSRSIPSTSSSDSSRMSSTGPSHDLRAHADVQDFGAESLIDGVTYINASFNEIDAVMKHLNDEDSDLGVERNSSPLRDGDSQQAAMSHTHESTESHSLLPLGHLRSDTTPPSPNRLREPYQYLPPTESESADTANRELVARNARFSPSYRPSKSDVRRLNSPGSRFISEWDDAVSSSEEQKFRTRSSFFDDRVHSVIGDIVKRHIGPLEKNLELIIKNNIAALSDRPSSRRPRRTLSEEAEQSDADDEDEDSTSQPRLKSPARDRSYDRLKASMQEISAVQQQLAPSSQLTEVINAFNELKTSLQQAPKSSGDIKTIVEEAVARQLRGRSGPITSSHQSATAEKSQLHIDGLESMLKIAEARAEDELKARRATEDALADSQRLLRSALQEAAEQRESAEETERSLANFHEERHETLRQTAILEGARENLEKAAAELSEKNIALEGTLEEYRLSSTQWRQEIEDTKAENSGLTRTISLLKAELEEGMKGRETLRSRFEHLQEDMTMASNDIARDQAMWRSKEDEHNAKVDLLSARLEAEARTRERLEVEIDRLEVQEKEAMRMRFVMDQTQKANVELERVMGQLKTENSEHQQTAARFEHELRDTRENANMELRRTQVAMAAEIDAARSQTDIVRADLQSVKSRLQLELDDATADVADIKARHNLMLQEASDSHQLALRQAAEAHGAALQECHRLHERTVDDLRSQQERTLNSLAEDKARSEDHLNQRLALADEKVAHYTSRVAHLEERLEIARSAAHAAVQAAQTQKSSATPPASRASLPFAQGTDIPQKISPQALRESIMVLQEQLQVREGRIEQLERELSEVDTDAPEKLKNQEMEITWLRELLSVRLDDLQDIIANLSQPSYDREAVKDAVIRLEANLQMEQQEKERAMAGGQNLPSLASISNLAASPRSLPLAAAAAWGNWRKARETPFGSRTGIANSNLESTPSRSIPSAQSFLSGLMTPPSTSVRQTPPTQQIAASTRQPSSRRPLRPYSTPRQSFILQEELPSKPMVPPTTPPLMRQASYDQDAQNADFTGDDVPAVHRRVHADDEPFGPCIDSVGHTP